MRIDSLPSQYKPFEEIDVCTNTFINGEILFVINDNVPLLIGQGRGSEKSDRYPDLIVYGRNWQSLVRDNKSLHPNC